MFPTFHWKEDFFLDPAVDLEKYNVKVLFYNLLVVSVSEWCNVMQEGDQGKTIMLKLGLAGGIQVWV